MAEVEILAGDGDPLSRLFSLAVFLVERLGERGRRLGQRHPVLRPLRPGDRRLDLGEIERDGLGEHGILGVVVAEHALRLGVGLDQGDALSPCGRWRRDRPASRRRSGRSRRSRHIPAPCWRWWRGPRREDGRALAVELDELADDAKAPQPLGDGEHEVGRGHAFVELAGQAKAHHLGDQHRDRLAEHRGFRLDAADAPAEHGEAVDHGGVAVGADQRIGEGDRGAVLLLGPHRLRQIFEIDLVADAGAGRHHAEIVEGGRAPAQEGVALDVPLIFPLDIDVEGARIAEGVDHHRMVDDEIDGDQRVDLARVAFRARSWRRAWPRGRPRRDAGEVLHQHPRRPEGDLAVALALFSQSATPRMSSAVTVRPSSCRSRFSSSTLSENGRRPMPGKAVGLGLLQAEIVIVALAGLERSAAFEAVERGLGYRCQRRNSLAAQS